ncbi:MAG: ATP phosphoribosyltransferase regulatory subunit, partial [Candidatus Competibacteraceae bacterium]|nr:ATP phosphoribosyltransferase regulatory subunit [Candidatus Competibacteraceae bacterium]
YGHSGDASDLEIIQLMLATLDAAVIDSTYLDLSHVGIFRGLVQQLQLSQSQEAQLFEILQRKALPDLDSWLAALNLSPQAATMLRALATLHGDEAILPLARQHLAEAPASVHQALDTLEHISKAVRRRHPALPIHLDLAELRGYHYHTGLVFAVYVAGQGQEIARGGRYDEIGAVFGRARPATGFSADLKTLLALSRQPIADAAGIYAPA